MIDRRAIEICHRKGLGQCRRWRRHAGDPIRTLQLTAREIGRAGATRVPCSCFMRGNPRRHFKGLEKLTIQERKAFLPEE
ncbi:MAG: hypothetical protein LBP92_14855 [Deltaproteobacteria bacterium]|jgi:hypothetical protein|nr:hypothetical protein [Deltaproteobacteria bacterium]